MPCPHRHSLPHHLCPCPAPAPRGICYSSRACTDIVSPRGHRPHESPVSVLSVLCVRHRRVVTRVPCCSLTEHLHCPETLRAPPLPPTAALASAELFTAAIALPFPECPVVADTEHAAASEGLLPSLISAFVHAVPSVFSLALPAICGPSAHLRGSVPWQPRARRRLEPHLTNPLWLDSWVARLCLCKQCDSEHP